ncbi:MAG: hypothetical protein KME49_32330 [Brasilonema octagenarum HA4186-MV1]|jgi:hypothetical protein|nr:hypothetical protein [Brasilonema octagenarum HA4186-MV1]
MPFSSYKSIGAVAKEFQIKYVRDNFIIETEFLISDTFRQELDLIFNEGVFDNSEIAICENIIYLSLVNRTMRNVLLNLLRNKVSRYDDPFEPAVPVEDWEVLQ